MKKIKFLPLFFLACFLTAGLASPKARALADPEIQSRVAVVMDRNTGEIFYSKGIDQLVYPASTTKIMTVLLAVEAVEEGRVSMYDSVTATENMNYGLLEDGTSAGITVGETMTLENLLYCAMLASANEACNVIAEYISGSIPDFVQAMNARAEELGCTDTHFNNTNGLPDGNHYTTAKDFTLIVNECASHELFMDICGTDEYTVPATNMSGQRNLTNSNSLISSKSIYGSKYLYKAADGIKTGYTSDAGYCLVSTAANEDDDIRLLACVFGGYSYEDEGQTNYTNFEDTITLYDWVFDNFSYQEVIGTFDSIVTVPVIMGADANEVSLCPESAVSALLPNDFDFSTVERQHTVYGLENGSLEAPIESGDILGELRLSAGGNDFGTVKLVAASGIELSRWEYVKSAIHETLSGTSLRIVIGVLIFLALVYLALVIRYRFLHLRHRRAQRAYDRAHPPKPKPQAPVQAQPQLVNKPPERRHPEPPQPQPLSTRTRRHAEQEASMSPPDKSYFAPDAAGQVPVPQTPPAQQFPQTPQSSAGSVPHIQSAAPAPALTEEEQRRAKAEQDYFENFFRRN